MAEFNLTDEQKLVQETMREFAQKELRTIALECDEKSTFPEEVLDNSGSWGSVLPQSLRTTAASTLSVRF